MLTYSEKEQCFIENDLLDIEHIYPKGAYLTKEEKSKINDIIDVIGDKILLEKSLNIKAGNKIYEQKKKKNIKNQTLKLQKILLINISNKNGQLIIL